MGSCGPLLGLLAPGPLLGLLAPLLLLLLLPPPGHTLIEKIWESKLPFLFLLLFLLLLCLKVLVQLIFLQVDTQLLFNLIIIYFCYWPADLPMQFL